MNTEKALSPAEQADPPSLVAMRCLLNELAVLIGLIEVNVKRNPQGVLPRLITANEATTHRIMDGIGALLYSVDVTGEPPEVAGQVRELAFAQLSAWSKTSPVFYHVYNTPREDFSNFEIVELILENRSAGGDVAAQVLDHYYLNMVTSRSFRGRFPLLASRLAQETARCAAAARPVRILNLHTGAGRVLELLAGNRAFVEAVQIVCLDRDPVALRRARQRLERYGARVGFVRADARQFVASRTWPEAPYDIIYAVNLLDQLDDEQTAKLIADCYRGLAPGGVLMFGNFAPSMPIAERAIIGWLMNWNIRVRPPEEWRRIFAQMWHDAECVRFELDELQTSQLVNARRP